MGKVWEIGAPPNGRLGEAKERRQRESAEAAEREEISRIHENSDVGYREPRNPRESRRRETTESPASVARRRLRSAQLICIQISLFRSGYGALRESPWRDPLKPDEASGGIPIASTLICPDVALWETDSHRTLQPGSAVHHIGPVPLAGVLGKLGGTLGCRVIF